MPDTDQFIARLFDMFKESTGIPEADQYKAKFAFMAGADVMHKLLTEARLNDELLVFSKVRIEMKEWRDMVTGNDKAH